MTLQQWLDALVAAVWASPTRTTASGTPDTPVTYEDQVAAAVWSNETRTVTGSIGGVVSLSGTISASSTSAATLTSEVPLSGTIAGTSDGTADLKVVVYFSGTCAGTSATEDATLTITSVPFLAAYSKRKPLLYGSEIPDETLTDYPKLFIIAGDTELAAELTSGGGVCVTLADGVTTTPFSTYSSSSLASGDVILRAKLTLSHTASTGELLGYIYYDSAQTSVEDRAGVVSNGYALFAPLEESPIAAAPQMRDWVTDTLIGSSAGNMTSGDLIAGQVGNGLDFDGSDDRVGFGTGTAIDDLTTLTISAIVRRSGVGGGGYGRVIDKFGAAFGAGSGWTLAIRNDGLAGGSAIGEWSFNAGFVTKNLTTTTLGGAAPNNTTQHVAVTWSGGSTVSSVKTYVNGVSRSLDDDGDGVGAHNSDAAVPLYIGNNESNNRAFPGWIDEVQVSSVVRSANWMAYASADELNNSQTFSLGAEELSDVVTLSLSGTISGTSSSTGVLTNDVSISGSADAVSTSTGTLTSAVPLSGTVTGASASSSALTSTILISGSIAGTSDSSGTLTNDVGLYGSISGQSTATGVLKTAVALTGTIACTSDSDALLGKKLSISGSTACASTSGGSLDVQSVYLGTCNATSTASGTLVCDMLLSGSVSGTSTGSGQLRSLVPLSGRIDTASDASGIVTTPKKIAGSVFGTSASSGTLRATVGLRGTIAATATAQAALRARVSLAGTINATSTASGVSRSAVRLSGSAGASSAAQSVLRTRVALAGTIAATSATTSVFRSHVSLSGTISNSSTSSATLGHRVGLSGDIETTSASSGTLRSRIALSGAIETLSDTSGNLRKTTSLSGTSSSVSSAEVALSATVSLSGTVAATSGTQADLGVFSLPLFATIVGTSGAHGALSICRYIAPVFVSRWSKSAMVPAITAAARRDLQSTRPNILKIGVKVCDDAERGDPPILAGVVRGRSSAKAVLSTRVPLSGTISGTSYGTLQRDYNAVSLSGTIIATSEANGEMGLCFYITTTTVRGATSGALVASVTSVRQRRWNHTQMNFDKKGIKVCRDTSNDRKLTELAVEKEPSVIPLSGTISGTSGARLFTNYRTVPLSGTIESSSEASAHVGIYVYIQSVAVASPSRSRSKAIVPAITASRSRLRQAPNRDKKGMKVLKT